MAQLLTSEWASRPCLYSAQGQAGKVLVTAGCGEGHGSGAVGTEERHLTPGGEKGSLGGCALGEVKEGQLLIQQREAESVLQAERAVGAKVLR